MLNIQIKGNICNMWVFVILLRHFYFTFEDKSKEGQWFEQRDGETYVVGGVRIKISESHDYFHPIEDPWN